MSGLPARRRQIRHFATLGSCGEFVRQVSQRAGLAGIAGAGRGLRRILQLLCSRQGWVFSREKILDHLWGDEKSVTDRSVDVHVKHLRDKLGPAGKMIMNVRGVGYKLAAPRGEHRPVERK